MNPFEKGLQSRGRPSFALGQPEEPQQGLGDPDFSIGRAGTQEQFPEAAAYARLADNKRQAEKVAAAFDSLGIKRPEQVDQVIQGEGYVPEEPGTFEKFVGALAGNPIGSGVLRFANILGGGSRVVQTALKELTNSDAQIGDVTGRDYWDIFWGDPAKQQEILMRTGIDTLNGSQLLAMWGWEEAAPDSVGERWARFGAHALVEIFTDPITALSLGAGAVGRKALGEAGDAAVQRVVREVVEEGLTDTATHQMVRDRLDNIGEKMYQNIVAGDKAAIAEVFGGTDDAVVRDMVKAAGHDYGAAEYLAEGVDEWAKHRTTKELQDELITPLLKRDFGAVNYEMWGDYLPKYAHGGVRVVSPFAFGRKKALEKGFVIPGTQGSGHDLWQATGAKVLERIAESKLPLASSKTVGDVFTWARKAADLDYQLLRAVKKGQLTGGEYMILKDAFEHSVTNYHLTEISARAAYETGDLFPTFREWGKASDELVDGVALNAKFADDVPALEATAREFEAGLHNFITRESDDLIFHGVKVDTSTELYEKAVRTREWARNVMKEYNEQIKAMMPEYSKGIENYLPFHVSNEMREFLNVLAERAPSLSKLEAAGLEGGADFYVGALLNSIVNGGVTEAAIGSSAYLNARVFTQSPMVMMAADQPLVMLEARILDNIANLLEGVKPGEIGVVEFNNLVSGKLKDLAAQYNVPLPKKFAGGEATLQVFTEDPFDLVNAYAHSMENTLRQRKAALAMEQFGHVQNVNRDIAVQRTIQEVRNRMEHPAFKKAIERIDKMVHDTEAYMPKFAKAVSKGDVRLAADEMRGRLTMADPDTGIAWQLYDRPLEAADAERYLVNAEHGGTTVVYHSWRPSDANTFGSMGREVIDPVTGTNLYSPESNLRRLTMGADDVEGSLEDLWSTDMVGRPYWDPKEDSWFQGTEQVDAQTWRLHVEIPGQGAYFIDRESRESLDAAIAQIQERMNPERVASMRQVREAERAAAGAHAKTIHAGENAAPGMDLHGGSHTQGEGKITEIFIGPDARVARALGDNAANDVNQLFENYGEYVRKWRQGKLEDWRKDLYGHDDYAERALTFRAWLLKRGLGGVDVNSNPGWLLESPTGDFANQGFNTWLEVVDYLDNHNVFPYINSAEDHGFMSYTIVGDTGLTFRESGAYVDHKGNMIVPLAVYDRVGSRFHDWNIATTSMDDAADNLFRDGELYDIVHVIRPQESGTRFGHPVVRLRLRDDWQETMTAGDMLNMQRDLLRFMRGRGDSSYEIVSGGVAGEKAIHAGSIDDLIEIPDEAILASEIAGLQRIERGLDPGEEFTRRAELVGHVSKRHRKNMITSGRAVDSESADVWDRAELGTIDHKYEFFINVYWDATNKKLKYRGQGVNLSTDTNFIRIGTVRVLPNSLGPDDLTVMTGQVSGGKMIYNEAEDWLEYATGKSFDKQTGKLAYELEPNVKNFAKVYENMVDDLTVMGKGWNKARLAMTNGVATGTSFGMDHKAINLHKMIDVAQLTDEDIFAMAMADIRQQVSEGSPAVQGFWRKWAIENYGKEAVELATKTPGEILDMYQRNFEFVEAIHKILKLGRDQDGEILQSTVFTATKDGDIAELLKEARSMSKRFGVDPDTFAPEYNVNALHQYTWVDPLTGVEHQRNLVNPELFAVGGPALEGKVVDRELAEWFGAVARNSATLYTPVGFAAMKTGFSEATRWWKAMATVTRPTFHIRNAMGAFWNNTIVGVRARDYAAISTNAIRIRKAMEKGMDLGEAIQSIPDKRLRKTFQAAFDHGIMDNSFAMSEIMSNRVNLASKRWMKAMKAVNPLSLEGAGVKVGGNVMESIEDFFRMAAFHAWYDPDNPATAKVAREMVYGVHFNYQYLTKYETKVKQFIPFFVWMRRNLPLQLQVLAERPGLMTRYAHIMEAFEANFGGEGQGADLPGSQYLTAFAADTGIVLNEGTPFWARIMLDPQIPPVDLFEHFDSLSPLEIIGNFSEGIHPAAQLVFSREQQQDYRDVNAPAPMSAIVEQLAKFGLWDVSQDGDVQIPYFMRTLLSSVAPFANEWNDIASSIYQPFQQEPTRLADLGYSTGEGEEADPDNPLVNALTGLGLTLGRGVGLQAKTPRDTASQAYRVQDMLTKLTNEQFRNTPGFQEAYENS